MISTETPVERLFGSEVLSHDETAVDLSRASRGLPILFDHGHDPQIGSKPQGRARNFRLDGTQLRSTLTFREGEVWDMVRDEDLTDVSIGYRVDEWTETDTEVRATKWTPMEVSMVAVPADHNAGTNRHYPSEDDMTADTNAAVKEQARKEERTRVAAMKALYKDNEPEMLERHINEGSTLDQARADLLDAILSKGPAKATSTVRAGATGEDGQSQRAMLDVLQMRSGNVKRVQPNGTQNTKWVELHDRIKGSEFRSMTLRDMARYSLEVRGINTMGWQDMRIFEQAMTRAVDGPLNQTTADFTNLLADQINKSVLTGWLEAPETWSAWAQPSTANDFKTGSRVHVSNFSSLAEVAENTDYTEGRVDDFAEPFTVKTYGKLWSITRQALVNDDQSGLGKVPRAMGRAAARSVGDAVYSVLTTNAAMSDAAALFSVAHANGSAAAAPPDVDTIDEGFRAIALQTDNNADAPNTLGLVARHIIVPLEYKNDARVAVNSTTYPIDNQAAGIINPIFQDNYNVISEHRLSADSPTDWYMATADETVEVIFLNGVQTPTLEMQPNWTRDGIHQKVRIDYDAVPVDWRGMFKNGTVV